MVLGQDKGMTKVSGAHVLQLLPCSDPHRNRHGKHHEHVAGLRRCAAYLFFSEEIHTRQRDRWGEIEAKVLAVRGRIINRAVDPMGGAQFLPFCFR